MELKQKIIILTTVITISALTVSYLALFSQSKIAPEFEKTDKSINTININVDSVNNTLPLSLADLKGKVVLVNFWTYSCINALRTRSTSYRLECKVCR